MSRMTITRVLRAEAEIDAVIGVEDPRAATERASVLEALGTPIGVADAIWTAAVLAIPEQLPRHEIREERLSPGMVFTTVRADHGAPILRFPEQVF